MSASRPAWAVRPGGDWIAVESDGIALLERIARALTIRPDPSIGDEAPQARLTPVNARGQDVKARAIDHPPLGLVGHYPSRE
jgi:hypothetical protein